MGLRPRGRGARARSTLADIALHVPMSLLSCGHTATAGSVAFSLGTPCASSCAALPLRRASIVRPWGRQLLSARVAHTGEIGRGLGILCGTMRAHCGRTYLGPSVGNPADLTHCRPPSRLEPGHSAQYDVAAMCGFPPRPKQCGNSRRGVALFVSMSRYRFASKCCED